jgi:hypothetical protein
MPDSNLSSQEASTSIPATKEEFLARALAVQDQLRAQNLDLSDLDLKLSSGWWKPAVDFSAVLHVRTLPYVYRRSHILSPTTLLHVSKESARTVG